MEGLLLELYRVRYLADAKMHLKYATPASPPLRKVLWTHVV